MQKSRRTIRRGFRTIQAVVLKGPVQNRRYADATLLQYPSRCLWRYVIVSHATLFCIVNLTHHSTRISFLISRRTIIYTNPPSHGTGCPGFSPECFRQHWKGPVLPSPENSKAGTTTPAADCSDTSPFLPLSDQCVLRPFHLQLPCWKW